MCHNKNILWWTYRGEAPEGLLYQCLAGSKNIDELFGPQRATHWPETSAYPSGHDDTVIVFIHLLWYKLNPNGYFFVLNAISVFTKIRKPTISVFFNRKYLSSRRHKVILATRRTKALVSCPYPVKFDKLFSIDKPKPGIFSQVTEQDEFTLSVELMQ